MTKLKKVMTLWANKNKRHHNYYGCNKYTAVVFG